ncbi:MAG TPA: nuclease-related domain-containing protein [Steroidobacteraceae bacterium]|nr:nuclease-related domain-containing protein [Steroidobacteraceae bacterium]
MNPPFGLTQIQFAMLVLGAAAVALLGFFGGRAWMLRRRDARRVARLTSGAADYLRNVLVPDGNGGDFHLDFVLLTSRGVVIIDLRDMIGNVFGGDQMTDWTLMDGPRRRTFANPQSGLYDRIASVKAIANDLPVEGRIVFTKRAKFPKGLPRFTVMLESVAAEFPRLGAAELEVAVSKYRPGWQLIKEACKPSPHFRSTPIAVA